MLSPAPLRSSPWVSLLPSGAGRREAPSRLHPGLLLILAALVGCEGGGPRPTPGGEGLEEARKGREGRLVLIGGALQAENTPVYRAVLDARWGVGPICVLPTASGAPTTSMEGYVQAFEAFGGPGSAVGVLLGVDNASDAASEEMADRLRGCGGFFFTGGIQTRILGVFRPGGEPSPAYHILWERFQAGAVVSGSSAGAAMMSDPMIADGGSQGALRDGVQGGQEGEGLWLTGGMGFFRHGLVDQHFLARGRWARLLVGLLATDGSGLGFGIDENTALVVEGDSAWVVGESGVVFLDARDASKEAGGNGGYGVRMFLLGADDRVDLRTGTVTWAPGKVSVEGGDGFFADPNADLFAAGTLPTVLFRLASARDRRVTFAQEAHFVEFRKEPGFRAMTLSGAGTEALPRGLSMGPFVISVWRR